MKLIICTVPLDAADALIERLLQERLIGCANVLGPVASHYWWKGEIERDEESVLFMETPDDRHAEAVDRLANWHPYEVPKIVTMDPADVNAAYAEWLTSVTRPG